MTDPRNRRRFARIPLQAKVVVVFPGVDKRRNLLLDNLSADGLFIRAALPKPVGTKLEFTFSVRDGSEPIKGVGVVRWVESDPQKPQGMGIKFLELNETGRKEILALLRQKSSKKSSGHPFEDSG